MRSTTLCLHTIFTRGAGYRHDPVTHGPFQFHIVALSYFLFGDNDFTSRIPAATFSVAAIAFLLFAYRRYLGRSGALIAGALFLISPYMLFYGRYTRNEGFIELIGVVLLYGILRYLEKGDRVGHVPGDSRHGDALYREGNCLHLHCRGADFPLRHVPG